MRLVKIINLAWNMLVHSKLRSWLTIIGIVIGIAAVVSIVSISEGAKQSLEEKFDDFGADQITITPGVSKARGFGPGSKAGGSIDSVDQEDLTDKDILSLKSVMNVNQVMGQVSATGELEYLGEGGEVSVLGVDVEVWKNFVDYELESGRLLQKGDSSGVVLGYIKAHEYFDREVQINRQITIEGRIFSVVGILEEGENNNAVIIPIDLARTVLEDIEEKEYSSIVVQIEDTENYEITIKDIEKKLTLSRGILRAEDLDFTVTSMQSMQETIQETMNTMSIFLGSIAAISLIVGGVGISNTMFTSVLEKTKEIGILKAIGTKNKDILLIFLFNSAMIGFVGGLGGVIIGIIASSGIGMLVSGTGGGMKILGNTAITPELLIFVFGFSIVVGMIAGIIPAYGASKLKPVDALRYE